MEINKTIKKKRIFEKFVHFFTKIKNRLKAFIQRFIKGSFPLKMSHFIMGFSNYYYKQIVKGLIYSVIQVVFILFMVISPEVNKTPLGAKAIVNFFTLGTEVGDLALGIPTDNSILMLLFGVVTFGIIFMFIFAYLSNLKSAEKVELDVLAQKKPASFKEDIKELLDSRFHITMLTPAIIGIILFTVLPTIFMILIAFTNFDQDHPFGLTLVDWVGFKNFVGLFSGGGEISVRFLPVLSWTLIWAFFATFTNYIGGILLALLLNKKDIKLKKLWRTVFVLTIALPQFVTLLAVRNILSEHGPFNSMLISLGILSEPIKFLATANNPWTARISIILINIWIGVPYTMLMTSGILMNVPKDLYEAAEIDGATKRQAFMKITVPYIIFITTPYLITSFIGNITSFNVIYLLTGGYPVVPGYKAGQTDLLVTWLYRLTIEESMYSIGSVVGILTFIITALGTLLSYRKSRDYKEEDVFQ